MFEDFQSHFQQNKPYLLVANQRKSKDREDGLAGDLRATYSFSILKKFKSSWKLFTAIECDIKLKGHSRTEKKNRYYHVHEAEDQMKRISSIFLNKNNYGNIVAR